VASTALAAAPHPTPECAETTPHLSALRGPPALSSPCPTAPERRVHAAPQRPEGPTSAVPEVRELYYFDYFDPCYAVPGRRPLNRRASALHPSTFPRIARLSPSSSPGAFSVLARVLM